MLSDFEAAKIMARDSECRQLRRQETHDGSECELHYFDAARQSRSDEVVKLQSTSEGDDLMLAFEDMTVVMPQSLDPFRSMPSMHTLRWRGKHPPPASCPVVIYPDTFLV